MTMRIPASLAIASILAFAATPVLAQGQNMDNMPGMNMPGMNMQNMLGMHMMAATVTAVDVATGLTDVDAGGLKLRVYFPPASLAGIKAGDKITLHLSFTKP
jgi:hypothetical protein